MTSSLACRPRPYFCKGMAIATTMPSTKHHRTLWTSAEVNHREPETVIICGLGRARSGRRGGGNALPDRCPDLRARPGPPDYEESAGTTSLSVLPN